MEETGIWILFGIALAGILFGVLLTLWLRILTPMGKAVERIDRSVGDLTAPMKEAVKRIDKGVEDLTTTLLGRRSGEVGERIVEESLGHIPTDWLERNVALGKGTVEFALKLPGGWLVPLDSKFVVPETTRDLVADSKGDDGQRTNEIVKNFKNRVREIAEYLGDERTLGFGIAAVPDSVYTVCKSAIPTSAQRHQIVIVPYSLLLPYTLSLYLMAQRLNIAEKVGKTASEIGAIRTALERAEEHLKNMRNEITSADTLRDKALKQLREALFHLDKSAQE